MVSLRNLAIAVLLVARAALPAQGQDHSSLQGFATIGVDALTGAANPNRVPDNVRGYAPTFTTALGARYQPAGPWGWELRAEAAARSAGPGGACLANLTGPCDFSTDFSSFGLQARGAYRLRTGSAWRPYLSAGAGLAYSREGYPLPIRCDDLTRTCEARRASAAAWAPMLAAAIGTDLGDARTRVFLELGLVHHFSGLERRTLLPLQLGLRF